MDNSVLVKVSNVEDIFKEYRNTPIEELLKYHNLGYSYDTYDNTELLIGTCMDYRISIKVPNNFAYIIRTGGANLSESEFHISYAISIGSVNTIVLMAHNKCGMVNLMSKKDRFINGLVERAGWDKNEAEKHFNSLVEASEIHDEIEFILKETKRFRAMYPKIIIAPLFYDIEDNLIYQIKE